MIGCAVAAVLGSGLWPRRAAAQEVAGAEIELTRPVKQSLERLQEGWLQWMSAFYQNNPERGEALVEDLVGIAEQLGLRRLPDLSRGAAARAVEVARTRDFERARWALAAAERLDPGRPETAFARAAVARWEGRYGSFLLHHLAGHWRLATVSPSRLVHRFNLLLWGLGSLLVAGALFVTLEMAVRGKALLGDLRAVLAGRLPQVLVLPVLLVVLLWPLAGPGGFAVLLLYWSVLLWGYGTRSERTVLVVLWLAAGAAPFVVGETRRQVELLLDPPVLAMENLAQGRLYGDLFRDLRQLPALLPEEPAVDQLLADLHRGLGQWDIARSLYREVLKVEPENAWALVDLGAYHFHQEDFGSAAQYFQRAAAAEPTNVVAHFNLSRAYSEAYLFEESRRALQEAQRIDHLTVSRYLDDTPQRRVVTHNGGFARIPEIRRLLARQAKIGAGAGGLERRLFIEGPTLLVALLSLGAAVLFQVLLRRRGLAPSQDAAAGASQSRLRRFLVPGLPSLVKGRGGRAFGALWAPVALLLLPAAGIFVYPLPATFDPGIGVALGTALLGLVGYFGIRLWVT